MGEVGTEVSKSQVTKRVVRKKQRSQDYNSVYTQLAELGAIALHKNKVVLLAQGVELLGKNLMNLAFSFDANISAKTANALLKWMRQQPVISSGSIAANSNSANMISSYEAFTQVALEVYDRLNRDFNLDDLVPIYRMRREIGERVARSQFDEWLLKMQANDILQLLEGSVEDSARDKIEDSVMTKINGLRCYAKRLDM